jgi:hypothetical protein
MFPAPYFAPDFFSPAYWLDGIPLPTPSVGGGTGNYFAPAYYSGYFAPAYWPGGPTPVVYGSFHDAVVGYLRPLFSDQLPGGINASYTGPGKQSPYADASEDDDAPQFSTDGSYFFWGLLKITVYAGDKPTAYALANAMATSLNDAPLTFGDGRLGYLRRAPRSWSKDPDLAPGGINAFQETRFMKYLISNV